MMWHTEVNLARAYRSVVCEHGEKHADPGQPVVAVHNINKQCICLDIHVGYCSVPGNS